MAFFNIRQWIDRISEHPNRRTLTNVEDATDVKTYDLSRAEGEVSVQGTALTGANLTDLERRIGAAFTAVENAMPEANPAEEATVSLIRVKINGTVYEIEGGGGEPQTGTIENVAIASFSDGADDVPVSELIVDIEARQDLHGYDKPWVGGAGKNKYKMRTTSATVNGITVIPNSDQTVQLSGTATGGSTSIPLCDNLSEISTLFGNGGTFILSLKEGTYGATLNVSIAYVETKGGATKYLLPNTPTEIPAGSIAMSSNLYVASGTTVQSLSHFAIQLESGSTATSYAPYSNICPITGFDSGVITRCGVNLWDEEWEVGSISDSDGSNATDNLKIRSKNYTPIKPSTDYFIVCPSTSKNGKAFFYDKNKTLISSVWFYGNTITTSPLNAYYIRFRMVDAYGTTYNNDISVNYPATDTSYHAYNGTTYTISLGDTYYGGYLNVTTGKLTINTLLKTYNGSENWTTRQSSVGTLYELNITEAIKIEVESISNMYVWETNLTSNNTFRILASGNVKVIAIHDDNRTDLATFKTFLSNNNLTISVELATPIEIQLTPVQVKTLLGNNNIFADTGNINKLVYFKTGCEAVAKLIEAYSEKDGTQTVLLEATDWDTTTNTITVDVAGVTATSNQEILPLPATSAANIANNKALQACNLMDYGQAAGQITLYAENIPSEDLSIRVIVRT